MYVYVITIAGLLYIWKRDPALLDRTLNKLLWTGSIIYAKTRSSEWYHSLSRRFGGKERVLPRTTSRIHPPVFDFSSDELEPMPILKDGSEGKEM